MIFGPSGPTLAQLGIEVDPQEEPAAPIIQEPQPQEEPAPKKPALPEEIIHALIDAGFDPDKTSDRTDLDLLRVKGIGPAALEKIRAAEAAKVE